MRKCKEKGSITPGLTVIIDPYILLHQTKICRTTWIRTMTNRVRVWYATVTLWFCDEELVFISVARYFNAAKVMHFFIPDKYKI
jgi:hypothetical protein